MFEDFTSEDKSALSDMLIEKIQNELGCKVKLVENEAVGAYESADSLFEDVKEILKITRSRLIAHKLNEGVYLNGEIEFNEAVDLSNKLMAKGLLKVTTVTHGNNSFIGFKTANDKFSLLLPKPNK